MSFCFRKTLGLINLVIIVIFILAVKSGYARGEDFLYQISLYPSDTYLESQDYLDQVAAPEAWGIIHDSPEVVVAVIDSGVDIEHPDLYENIWHNPDEIPKDGVDNDNNGYIDDTAGWDFVLNIADPRPKFAGQYSKLGINHGTIVAGVIGAVGNNNFGLTGVSWKIKIMPLRVMDGEGVGSTNLAYLAIKYAIDKGADIINLSIIGGAFDPLLSQVIEEAYQQGIVIVASAGNEMSGESGEDLSLDLAEQPQYPVCHDGGQGHNYILGVGSVNDQDVKSNFSNYGLKCLDLFAPAEGFYSALFFSPVMPEFNQYFGGYWSGTSLATPQVSATAALAKALRPDLTNQEIYDLIISSSDNIDGQNPFYEGGLGGGRLNIYKVIKAVAGLADQVNLVISPASQHLPAVQVVNRLGQKNFEFLAYNENFLGGVSLAAADWDADGQKEIITAAGAGGGPHIRLFDANGQLVGQFFAYNFDFTGGVNVAAGDVDGDGQPEIITAPQGNLQPQVKIFDLQGNLEKDFLAFDINFNGGVNLALSDVNADGIKEIVAAAGPGGSPLVKIFNQQGFLLKQFFAYEPEFGGGVKVSAADLHSDLRTEIITTPQSGKDCQVKIFSPAGDIEQRWSAPADGQLGCNQAVGNIDDDELTEIIISSAKNSETAVKIFDQYGNLENSFTPFADDFKGGVNAALK
ncbi:S8 family serine peptidase [Patescibacteria group bacterium]|nr:S8 family serine peptidase [Patescibacteria group bacterium]